MNGEKKDTKNTAQFLLPKWNGFRGECSIREVFIPLDITAK